MPSRRALRELRSFTRSLALALVTLGIGCAHEPAAAPVRASADNDWTRSAPEREARVAARCEQLLSLEQSGRLRRFSNPYQLRGVKESRVINEWLASCHELQSMKATIGAAEAKLQPVNATTTAPTP